MATKERFQNPTGGDTLNLRFFSYNSNNLRNVSSIDKVELFVVDKSEITDENPHGLRLVETIDGGDVVRDCEGKYHASVLLDDKYVIGRYVDRWHVFFETSEPSAEIDHWFDVYSDLWYTTPIPVVYDFNFTFRPNKLRKGSKQYLLIQVSPVVPTSSDLGKYYENLAIVGEIAISIEQFCGPCTPAEADLRLVVDKEAVTFREKTMAYYQLDTEDMACGMYNVWFQLDMGGNVYISDKMQLQIFE